VGVLKLEVKKIGKLIVFEGVDGIGKSTQIYLLYNHYKNIGKTVKFSQFKLFRI